MSTGYAYSVIHYHPMRTYTHRSVDVAVAYLCVRYGTAGKKVRENGGTAGLLRPD